MVPAKIAVTGLQNSGDIVRKNHDPREILEKQAARVSEFRNQHSDVPPAITPALVIMARARLTLNKVSGVDGVVSEMLKELPLIIVYLVTYAFQERYMDPQSTPLHAWLQIILVFIPKGIIPRVPDMKIHWNLLAQCPGQMVQHGFSYAIGRRATTIPLEENLSRRR